MDWELDHIYFATNEFESVENELTLAGLEFTRRRSHPGQGTANACTHFENAFFEILHMVEPQEIGSEVVQPLRLAERIQWQTSGACPFGICFRKPHYRQTRAELPDGAWSYRPPYLPEFMELWVLTPPNLATEPMVFFLLDNSPSGSNQPSHKVSRLAQEGKRLTHIHVGLPGNSFPGSHSLQWLAGQEECSVTEHPRYQMQLTWDLGSRGKECTFSEQLPLVFRW
jgi:hypothetical protein